MLVKAMAYSASALLFVFSMSGAGWASVNARIGYLSRSVSFGPLWVAKETGIFARNGIVADIIYVQPAILTQAMLAGELSLAASGGSTMIEANLRGADFVILGSWLKSPGLNYLITRKEITRPEQLKGKRFGISRLGAAPHRILQLTVAKLGMDPNKDVSFLQIGNPAVVAAAIQTGRVDAGLGDVETAYAAGKLGLSVLLEVRDLGIEYLTLDLVTKRSVIEKNEETVRAFMKSIVEGIHYFITKPEPTMAILARYTGQDLSVVKLGYDYYAKGGLQPKPYISIPGVKAVLEHISQTNPKAKEARPEQFYDSKYVRELDQSGFIDNLYK
jgi:NitT/TauT family transport system substrate-binding protein